MIELNHSDVERIVENMTMESNNMLAIMRLSKTFILEHKIENLKTIKFSALSCKGYLLHTSTPNSSRLIKTLDHTIESVDGFMEAK